MAIQVSVSNLNPTPSEIVTFTGSASPIEDISMNVYNEFGQKIATYTIYLKTHGISQIRLIPGHLDSTVQTWKFVGKDTGTQDSAIITIQEAPPPPQEYTLTISSTTGGTTNPSGSRSYPEGTTVAVRAYPYSGYVFSYWRLNGITYTSNPINVQMNSNASLEAIFSVAPPPPPPPEPSGILQAIRVQDVSTGKWYTWDRPGPFTPTPVCTPGVNNLYIAVWVVNQGGNGNLTLTLKDDTGQTLASKTAYVASGVGIGVEWTGDKPVRNYAITIKATP